MSFWLRSFCGYWEGWDSVNRFDNTSWVAVDTPTDRPKSDRNRCVIEILVVILSCHAALLAFLLGVGAFVIGLSQIFSS